MWEALFSPSVASWHFSPFAPSPRVMPLQSFCLPGKVSSLLFILASLTGLRAVGRGRERWQAGVGSCEQTSPECLASPSTAPLCLESQLPVSHPPNLLMCPSPGTGALVRPQITCWTADGKNDSLLFSQIKGHKRPFYKILLASGHMPR